MTGSLVWLARFHCGILRFTQDDIAVFRVTPPWEGKGEAFPLDFCCKVTTKIFGTWLCCHLLSFAVIYFSPLHSYHARLQRIMDGKYFLRGAGPTFVFRRSVTRETNIRRWGNAYASWWYQISISVYLRTLLQSCHPIYIGHIYVIIYTTYI